MSTGRICFVTGATGFVGLNLVSRLLEEGWCVHALTRDKLSSAASRLESLVDGSPFASRLVVVEVLRESFEAAAVARRVAAGGLMEPGWVPETSKEHMQLNIAAAEQVLQASKLREVRRIVYCSSWSAYGFQPAGTVVDESTPSLAKEPFSWHGPVPYSCAKAACEDRFRNRTATLGIELVILQPGSIFGPWGEAGWCQLFAKAERDPKIVGCPGSSTFVDVRDLAGTFVAAADAGPGAGESYIIGGTNASNLKLQHEVARLVGVPAPRRALPPRVLQLLASWNEAMLRLPTLFHRLRFKPDVIGHPWLVRKLIQDQTAECKKAKAVLGLRPRPLSEMLAENYAHLVRVGICKGKVLNKLPVNEGSTRHIAVIVVLGLILVVGWTLLSLHYIHV